VSPEGAVEAAHFAILRDDGRWGCLRCDWTGATIDDYWAAHETRRDNDNIPF